MTNAESLYILTGESTFNVSLLSFSRAGLIATADLNGDGNGDLVVVNGNNVPGTAQVFVLLGNPDGSFQTAVPYTIPGANSVSAAIDDFNGDGKLDIIASSDNGQLSLLTGKGDGTFNAAQSFAAPTPVYPGSTLTPSASLSNLISADLRNTGHKDLIASNGLVMLNDGTGNFTAASSAAFPPATSLSNGGPYIASGDINRDGNLDIVLSTGSSTLTYLGKGDGTFTPGLGYVTINSDGFVTVTDLDGDGNPDIYIGDANGGLFRGDSTDTNIAYALMGNGDGTFQGAPTITGLYTGTNLGDVNGDGQPDLITNNIGQYNQSEPSFVVELGTSKGTFTPTSTITLPPSITVSVSELLSPVTINTANLSITSYAVGDLNGDGKDDLAFVFNNGGYAVYGVALSNGDGTFATPIAYGFPQIAPSNGFDITTTISNLQIGDFNHDGKADLLFSFNDIAGPTGTYLQGLVVLPGIGNGTFGAPIFTYTYNATTTPPNGGIPSIASINDLNGDNIPDLLAFNSAFTVVNGIGTPATTLQVYLGKGDGTFAAPTTVATSTKLSSLVVTDFNKDGKLDICCLGESAIQQGQLFIALGNGDGTFHLTHHSSSRRERQVPNSGLASADFDGDGNNDLAFLDSESFSGIFYGKGDGTFTSVPIQNNNIAPKDLVNLFVGGSGGASIALDLNKDGHPDILSGNALLLSLYGTSTATPTPVSTTTALTGSATTITTGTSVTFTATITPAAGSTGTPTGSVTFLDGITTLKIVPVTSGKTTYTTTSLTTGSHGITAVYSGDSAFTTSTSSVFLISVSLPIVPTTTTLTASATNPVIGTTLTLTATVSPASGTAIPTGTVIFNDGSTALNTGTLDATGKATFSTAALTVGTHNITAAYVGATGFASSTSPTVTVTIAPADFTLSLPAHRRQRCTRSNHWQHPHHHKRLRVSPTRSPAPEPQPTPAVSFLPPSHRPTEAPARSLSPSMPSSQPHPPYIASATYKSPESCLWVSSAASVSSPSESTANAARCCNSRRYLPSRRCSRSPPAVVAAEEPLPRRSQPSLQPLAPTP